MEVILLEKIQGLGNLGQTVKVKPGFGRNYLIPQGKAMRATPENQAVYEKRRQELETRANEHLAAAQKRGEALAGMSVTIVARVSGEGRLYGSVGAREIAQAITDKGVPVDKAEVLLHQGALREVGRHQAAVNLHPDVSIEIAVLIEGEEGDNLMEDESTEVTATAEEPSGGEEE